MSDRDRSANRYSDVRAEAFWRTLIVTDKHELATSTASHYTFGV